MLRSMHDRTGENLDSTHFATEQRHAPITDLRTTGFPDDRPLSADVTITRAGATSTHSGRTTQSGRWSPPLK